MNETSTNKLPVWFWVVAGLLIVWNIIGCASWVMDLLMTEEALTQLPPEQQALYAERPDWILIVYAVAVFDALAASVLLLLRSKLSILLYAMSLLAVVVQFGYVLFVMDAIGTMGFVQAAAFPIFIVLMGVFELWFSIMAKGKGWLR